MSEPLNKSSNRFYEDIIERIKIMIAQGNLKPGDRLPSERELAEYFDVSRVPVREALKILEYMGVISNRRGDGMYLNSTDLASIFSKMNFAFSVTKRTLRELFEVRDALEASAAYHAALRRTDNDIANLRNSLEHMERIYMTPEDTAETRRALSHEFHTHLVTAAHNAVLSNIYDSLFELLDISKQITLTDHNYSEHSQASHYEIFQCVVNGDSAGAQQAMINHMHSSLQKLDGHLPEEKSKDDRDSLTD